MAVKREKLADIDVPDAVAVGETEVAFIDVIPYAPEPSACLGRLARVDERDLPWLCAVLMNLELVVLHIERDVRHVQKVVGEVLLDQVPLVAEAHDEFV